MLDVGCEHILFVYWYMGGYWNKHFSLFSSLPHLCFLICNIIPWALCVTILYPLLQCCGLDLSVGFYNSVIVTGIRFHTKSSDDRYTIQYNCILVKGSHGNDDFDFYGAVTKIIELNTFSISKWFYFGMHDLVWQRLKEKEKEKRNTQDFHF